MTQEKEMADRIMDSDAAQYLMPEGWRQYPTGRSIREAIAAALRTAREEGYRQGVDDAAKVVAEACAGWLAQFEGGTITYVSASTYAADAVRDVADVARNRLLALTPSSAPAEPGGKR